MVSRVFDPGLAHQPTAGGMDEEVSAQGHYSYAKSGLGANHLQVVGRERRAPGNLLQLQSQTSPV